MPSCCSGSKESIEIESLEGLRFSAVSLLQPERNMHETVHVLRSSRLTYPLESITRSVADLTRSPLVYTNIERRHPYAIVS